MAASKSAPRELDPFAKGKIANMHADVGAGVPRRRRCTRRPCASTSGAGAVPDVRRHPHRARQHAARDGRHRRGAIREFERVRAENPRFVAGRLQLGLVLLRGGAARRGRRRVARGAGRRRPRTGRRRCTSRCSTRRRRRQEVGAQTGTTRRRRRHVLTFTPSPDRFVVEEIPAYAPSRRGRAHVPVDREARPHDVRRDRAASRARSASTRATSATPGMKDRHATTRQWLSVPRLDPERALALSRRRACACSTAVRHGNKLRIGHLRGNRFEVVLTGAATRDEVAALARAPRGRSARDGRRPTATASSASAPTRRQRRARPRAAARRAARARPAQAPAAAVGAAVGGVQPRARAARATRGALRRRALRATCCRRRETGGLFVVDRRPRSTSARVDAGELVPTGPAAGRRARSSRRPARRRARSRTRRSPRSARRARTSRARAAICPGARRPVLLVTSEPAFADDQRRAPDARDALRVRFALPAGSYATVAVDAAATVVVAPAR